MIKIALEVVSDHALGLAQAVRLVVRLVVRVRGTSARQGL